MNKHSIAKADKSLINIDVLPETSSKPLGGAQTLIRGLDVLCAVSQRQRSINEIADEIGLTRSTVHRLASTLVEHRFLAFTPRVGYGLGPKVLELGYLASRQMSLPRIAHDHLLQLANTTGDTVHLGVLDGNMALYLDKVSGRRRVEISSRIGERQPLRSTGLGKALLLDEDDRTLSEVFQREEATCPGYPTSEMMWLERMRTYRAEGYALDLEENEDRVRCVAAPIRGASGAIIGSLSVSSAAQYMDDKRMQSLVKHVVSAAAAISGEYGSSYEKQGQRS